MANRVVHFEIHCSDPKRAMKFYKDVFGWTFDKWGGGAMEYWMVMTGPKDSKEPGINGGLMPRPCEAAPMDKDVTAYVCTVDVKNLDATAKKIEKAGGTLALAKMAIPGMAWLAYYKDTEGNTFGIFQEDKSAK